MIDMEFAKSLALFVAPPLERFAFACDDVGQGAGVDLTAVRQFQNIRLINYYLAIIDWRNTTLAGKRLSHRSAACLRAWYCAKLVWFDLVFNCVYWTAIGVRGK
jgi:hypothetical protein